MMMMMIIVTAFFLVGVVRFGEFLIVSASAISVGVGAIELDG